MKDITDYFKSSPDDVITEKSRTENIKISKKTQGKEGESPRTTPKSSRLTKRKQNSVNGSEISPTTPKLKSRITKRRTAKSTNKSSPVRSPQEAYNILFNLGKNQSTEKDSSNSRMEKTNFVEIEESNSLDKVISLGIQATCETPKLDKTKVDAFQFLMKSRNKVIGTNSPGKELTEQDVVSKCPEKLSARKRLLHSWSDSIQAKKRKLNDDEVDKYIKVKLNTRKERLKSLLHIDDNAVDEIENTPKAKRKKSSLKNMKTEVNNSNKEGVPTSNGSIKKVSKKIKKDAKGDPKTPVKVGSSGDDFEMKIANGSETGTPKSSKSHKHKKREDKLAQTPRSKWKMKIKLINQDIDDTNSCSKQGEESDTIVLNESENFVEEITENVDCHSTHSAKIDVENNLTENTCKEMDCQNETADCQSTHTPKINEENDIIVLDDTENAVEVTEEIDRQIETADCQPKDTPKSNEKIPESNRINNEYRRVLRNRTSLKQNQNIDYVYSSSEDSDDEVKRKNNKKAVKIAPVFIKAIPKPKIDPKVLEARRKFLMSEMPDELRKRVEKIRSNGHIEIDFDVFPKVSHVYQEEKNNPLWNLADPCLEMNTATAFNYEVSKLLFESLIDSRVVEQSRFGESEPIKNIKTILMDMKMNHTSYPVYRAFRLLKEKNGFKLELSTTKTTPKRERKLKKSAEKKEDPCTIKDTENNLKHLMWTEKYKPRSSEDFFGNIQGVSTLKKWLEKWREVLDSGKRKNKHYSSDSDSEFMSSDAESVYDRSLPTTMILSGPCGSGKSSSVYAVCNELGLNVLELNASSRRTGKKVLQELQEATRSHQVRKNKGALDLFTQKGTSSKPEKDVEKNKTRKMCLLLIEDIDIVFEQDEGFISAISQISASSKRPIVLTTSNENSVYALKFLNEFKTIRFHPFSVKSLGIWLQILCVLEGIFIDLSSIGELLEYNRGDIRKTLLELQYWTQSGGQINKRKTLLDPIFKIESLNEDDNLTPIFDDALIPLKELDGKLDDYRIHSNILSDFETFNSVKFNNIPTITDLKTLWWNIPKFLSPVKPKPSTQFSKKSKTRNRKRLKLVSDMYESTAIFDVSYRKIGYKCDEPVCITRWHHQLQDSLELEEKNPSFSIHQDILELNHYLTDGYLDSCKKRFLYESSENQRFLNMAVPGLEKERQLENNHKYEEELLRPVPTLNSLDRKSVVLDYLPSLRTIARTECKRAKTNVKRHNRFYNYLQTLNITCDTPILDFATRTFAVSRCSE